MGDMTTAPAEKKADKKKNGFFAGVKSEFKKIIWPTGQDLAKESVAVIVSTAVIGAVIALLDLGIQNLIGNVL